MADAKRCDRCGQFYLRQDKSLFYKDSIICRIALLDIFDCAAKRYDLCDECCQELLEFLGEKE